MIISHKHKYLFVELYQTGSTAISKALQEDYDGEPILYKHAYYEQFLKVASPEEKNYVVFSCIRNPLNMALTSYYKFITNHDDFENPKNWKKNGGWINKKALRQYYFIKKNNLSFKDYFNRYHSIPYDNWSRLSHKKMHFVIKFENLNEDFSQCLSMMGIKQKRPLQKINVTKKPDDPFSFYSEDIRNKVIKKFGPFMQKWDYEFPSAWGEVSVPLQSKILFELFCILRYIRWYYEILMTPIKR